jgi:hypothetical protein
VTGHALTAAAPALRRSRRLTWLAVTLSAIAGAAASLAVLNLVLPSGDARPAPRAARFVAPGHAFALGLPQGWSAAPQSQLGSLPGTPLAFLRRDDGSATVVVRPASPVRASGPALARRLGAQLRGRFPGFQPVSARFAPVRGGRAFVYTFVHGADHQVQSLALVQARGRAYAVDTVVHGDSPAAARQAGAVVASFGP